MPGAHDGEASFRESEPQIQLPLSIQTRQAKHKAYCAFHKINTNTEPKRTVSPVGTYSLSCGERKPDWSTHESVLKVTQTGQRYRLNFEFGRLKGCVLTEWKFLHRTELFDWHEEDAGAGEVGASRCQIAFDDNSFFGLSDIIHRRCSGETIRFNGLRISDETDVDKATISTTKNDRNPGKEPYRLINLPGQLRSMIANLCDESSYKIRRVTCKFFAHEMPSSAWFELDWLKILWWPSTGFHYTNDPLSVSHRSFCPQRARTVTRLSIRLGTGRLDHEREGSIIGVGGRWFIYGGPRQPGCFTQILSFFETRSISTTRSTSQYHDSTKVGAYLSKPNYRGSSPSIWLNRL